MTQLPHTCCGMGIAESHCQTQEFYFSSQHGQLKCRFHPGRRRECIQTVTRSKRKGAQYWESGIFIIYLLLQRQLGEENTSCKLLEELKYSKQGRESGSPGSGGLECRRKLSRQERDMHCSAQSKPYPCRDVKVKTCPVFSRA